MTTIMDRLQSQRQPGTPMTGRSSVLGSTVPVHQGNGVVNNSPSATLPVGNLGSDKLKLVIRLLPPDIDEKWLMGLLRGVANDDTLQSYYFVQGHVSRKSMLKQYKFVSKPVVYSRLYLNMRSPAAVAALVKEYYASVLFSIMLRIEQDLDDATDDLPGSSSSRFDSGFSPASGQPRRHIQKPILEYAPLHLKLKASKGHPLEGTIDSDDDYLQFVKEIEAERKDKEQSLEEAKKEGEEDEEKENKESGENEKVIKLDPKMPTLVSVETLKAVKAKLGSSAALTGGGSEEAASSASSSKSKGVTESKNKDSGEKKNRGSKEGQSKKKKILDRPSSAKKGNNNTNNGNKEKANGSGNEEPNIPKEPTSQQKQQQQTPLKEEGKKKRRRRGKGKKEEDGGAEPTANGGGTGKAGGEGEEASKSKNRAQQPGGGGGKSKKSDGVNGNESTLLESGGIKKTVDGVSSKAERPAALPKGPASSISSKSGNNNNNSNNNNGGVPNTGEKKRSRNRNRREKKEEGGESGGRTGSSVTLLGASSETPVGSKGPGPARGLFTGSVPVPTAPSSKHEGGRREPREPRERMGSRDKSQGAGTTAIATGSVGPSGLTIPSGPGGGSNGGNGKGSSNNKPRANNGRSSGPNNGGAKEGNGPRAANRPRGPRRNGIEGGGPSSTGGTGGGSSMKG